MDVELVPLPAPAAPGLVEQRLFSLPLSPRFFMFGVGVGPVAAGTGLGLLGAWLAALQEEGTVAPRAAVV